MPAPIDPDVAYAAVLARAEDADFVYAVVTTGIYCRPRCRAKRPRRDNARYFHTPDQARVAGYRACKRCDPDAATPRRDVDRVARLCRLIDDRVDAPPSLAELADHAGLSASHTHRVFKSAMGMTPAAYARARRAERFRAGLAEAPSVTEAIHEAGFGSSSRCYEHTDNLLGMTPSAYRSGAPGQTIQYATGPCSLGRVLVAVTERGVCAILLGDDAAELVDDLKRRFDAADLVPSTALTEELRQVVAAVDRHQPLALPLDVRGTAFQQRVWAALGAIPAGQTVSYGELAAGIGKPEAVRAVASACAANPLAVVVPCHRVRRQDGTLGGYRWGLERKRELLDREADDGSPDGSPG